MNSSSVLPKEQAGQQSNIQKDTTPTNDELLIQYQEENEQLRNQLIILQTENTNLKQIIEENSSTITAAKKNVDEARNNNINKCGQHPWTLKCFHHYNTGNWTTLDHPRHWTQHSATQELWKL